MQLNLDEQGKMLEVWLTGEESQTPDIVKQLNPYRQMCAQKKYKLVLFRSGRQELPGLTGELLLHNRAVCACPDEDMLEKVTQND